RPGYVDPLPERERPEQAHPRVLGESPDEGGHLVLTLAEEGDPPLVPVEPCSHDLGGVLRGAHRGEQSQGASAGGPDEELDLVEEVVLQTVATWRREVSRHIRDRLLAVVER